MEERGGVVGLVVGAAWGCNHWGRGGMGFKYGWVEVCVGGLHIPDASKHVTGM